MPPFGPLPRGPVLVLAAALAGSAGAQESTTEPPSAEVESAIELVVEVRAATKGELDERARESALLHAFTRMPHLDAATRQHVAMHHTPREILANQPDFLPMERMDKRVHRSDDGVFVGTFTFGVDPAAIERVQQALRTQWATPVGTIGVTPLGHFVVVDPDVTFLPGDRIVTVNGEPVTRASVGAIGHGMPVRLERQGISMELTSPAQSVEPILYDDARELAPTCGPCCHGDCDDREIYGPRGPFKKHKGGR